LGSIRLDSKVAIVTGATKGIGRATALAFAAAGAAVVGVARNASGADALVVEAIRVGGSFRFVAADVSRWEDCERVCRLTMHEFGRIDILVNNAGTSLPHARLSEISEQDWRQVAGVTLDGVLFMSRHAVPYMIVQRDGVVINIASSAAVQTAASMGCYAAAKAAAVQLARVLAVENVDYGVRANALLVGSTKTELSDRARAALGSPTAGLVEGYAAAVLDGISTAVRLSPQGVADAVLTLCADEAREITAAVVSVDHANVAGYSHGKLADLAAAPRARS
jgi:A-factor type gamma-butyrolactone 1'-reductase (1S-forming)